MSESKADFRELYRNVACPSNECRCHTCAIWRTTLATERIADALERCVKHAVIPDFMRGLAAK